MKNKQVKSISITIILVFLITIVSKILGFVRDAVIAYFFGADAVTDAFFLANSMPTLIFPTLCTAFSTAFLSLYAKKNAAYTKEETHVFASKVVTATVFFAVILSALGSLFSPFLVKIMAPGFSDEITELCIRFTAILMPTFAFNMMIYMANAVLDAHKRHVIPQSIGLISNVIIICGLAFMTNSFGVYTLVLFQFIAVLAQAIFVLMFTARYWKFGGWKSIFSSEFWEVTKLAFPIIIGNSLGQINQIVAKMVASMFQEGSMSSINYANTLCNVVYAILIVPVLSIVYPRLSEKIAMKQVGEAHKLINYSMLGLVVVVLPLMIVFSVCGREIVTIIYGRGAFDSNAVEITGELLQIYAWGFIGFGVRELMTKMFYAEQNTRTPMVTGTIAIGVNIVLSIVFSLFLGCNGIALATTISLNLGAILLLVCYLKRYAIKLDNSLVIKVLKVLVAFGGAWISLLAILPYITDMSAFLIVVLCGVVVFTVYEALLILLNIVPLRKFVEWYFERRKKK